MLLRNDKVHRVLGQFSYGFTGLFIATPSRQNSYKRREESNYSEIGLWSLFL